MLPTIKFFVVKEELPLVLCAAVKELLFYTTYMELPTTNWSMDTLTLENINALETTYTTVLSHRQDSNLYF